MLELPPLGLYIHIPWCIRKCPYCDFNSHERPGAGIPEAEYVDALVNELRRGSGALPSLQIPDSHRQGNDSRSIETVFFGGGTPSLFSGESIARILDPLQHQGSLASGAEITLEANPGTAEAGRFAGYREAGVNRLSIGAQSFDDGALNRLGRIHSGAEAQTAFAMARDAGFNNINLDLMFGLPGQDEGEALRDLETAIAMAPEHISWYQLTLEANTVFWRRPPPLPEGSVIEAIQHAGNALLEGAGYARYEVSAFARPDKQCRHNLNYWRFGDYLGIGAGAHGKLTEPGADRILRTRRTRMPAHYLATGARTITTEVKRDERPLEFLMNALRLREGFKPGEFSSRTGVAFSAIGEKLKCLARDGLLEVGENHVRASDRGYRLLDGILGEFT